MKIQWWQMALMPVRLVVLAYWGIRCTVGLHDWYRLERPAWRDGLPVPWGWHCHQACLNCGRIKRGSWHLEPWRNGQSPTEWERKQQQLATVESEA